MAFAKVQKYAPSLIIFLICCSSSSTNSGGNGGGGGITNVANPDGGVSVVATTPPQVTCTSEGGTAAVSSPVFVRNIKNTGTSWFGSPSIYDLDGDGQNELIGAFYDLYVWSADGAQLAKAPAVNDKRIYPPAIVADLDGDKVTEIVVGKRDSVVAYEYRQLSLTIKPGWPQKAATSGDTPEVRGLAAADIDGDGKIEVVATNTAGNDKPQVYVFRANGTAYQPSGLTKWTAWPRYNNATGEGNDADANGLGHHGYGCYGLNVAIGNLDDDAQQEIVVTYDNHRLNVFNHDGTSMRASSWYTNRETSYLNKPLDYGQFIRWEDQTIEDNHYHLHQGEWPSPGNGQIWLQWTASPPAVADVDGDGHNEVIGVANAETNEPYRTMHNSFTVLEGNYGTADRAARRLPGWEKLFTTGAPQARSGDYPPLTMPAVTVVDLDGDKMPELIAPSEDGFIYAVTKNAQLLWKFDARHGRSLLYPSEVIVADLNKDGKVEVLFTTWGGPADTGAGYLVILDASGNKLFDIQVPGQGANGNGIGLPAAPTVGDLDGDGQLEIIVQSFDHGLDIFRVPGSGTKCLLWPTGRGNYLRNALGPLTK